MQEHDIKFNRWNAWSSGSLDIPWEPNAAAKLWYELESGTPTDFKEQRDVGPGEHRLAYELGAEVDPSTKEYDVLWDGKKIEVKAVSIGTALSFRGSPGSQSAFKFTSEISKIVSHLLTTFDKLSADERKMIDSMLDLPIKLDEIIEVLEDNKKAVMKSNFSFRRLYGFSPKTKKAKRIIGLFEIVDWLADSIKKRYSSEQSRSMVVYTEKGVWLPTKVDNVKIASLLSLEYGKDISKKDVILSELDADFIRNKDKIKELWNEITARETFCKSDYFFAVDNKFGFFPIKIDEINDWVQFKGISKDLSFTFKKKIIELLEHNS